MSVATSNHQQFGLDVSVCSASQCTSTLFQALTSQDCTAGVTTVDDEFAAAVPSRQEAWILFVRSMVNRSSDIDVECEELMEFMITRRCWLTSHYIADNLLKLIANCEVLLWSRNIFRTKPFAQLTDPAAIIRLPLSDQHVTNNMGVLLCHSNDVAFFMGARPKHRFDAHNHWRVRYT